MSAFLCDDCHLTALAAYYYDHRPEGVIATMHGVFTSLRDENLRSLEHRYPGQSWYLDIEPVGPRLCDHCERSHFTIVEIVKAAQCYEYQACEHAGWEKSRAHAITTYIVEHALGACARAGGARTLDQLRNTPGYEAAAWGLTPQHKR